MWLRRPCYGLSAVRSRERRRGCGLADVKPLLDTYLAAVRAELGARLSAVALYGSVARGEAHASSDIDLFVIHRGVDAEVFEVFLQAALRLRDHRLTGELQARDVPTEPYPVLRSERGLVDTPWLLLDICDHGIVLFDPHKVLETKLARLRARMRELGSQRIELPDGSWYWDLKPDLRPGETFAL